MLVALRLVAIVRRHLAVVIPDALRQPAIDRVFEERFRHQAQQRLQRRQVDGCPSPVRARWISAATTAIAPNSPEVGSGKASPLLRVRLPGSPLSMLKPDTASIKAPELRWLL
jgi:hypothetical protein